MEFFIKMSQSDLDMLTKLGAVFSPDGESIYHPKSGKTWKIVADRELSIRQIVAELGGVEQTFLSSLPEEDEGNSVYNQLIFKLEIEKLFGDRYLTTKVNSREIAQACDFEWDENSMLISDGVYVEEGLVWAIRVNGEFSPTYVITKPNEHVRIHDFKCLTDILWKHRHDELEIVELRIFKSGKADSESIGRLDCFVLGNYRCNEPSLYVTSNRDVAHFDDSYGFLKFYEPEGSKKLEIPKSAPQSQINIYFRRLVSWKPCDNTSQYAYQLPYISKISDKIFPIGLVINGSSSMSCFMFSEKIYTPKIGSAFGIYQGNHSLNYHAFFEHFFAGPDKLYRADIGDKGRAWLFSFNWHWKGCPAKILRDELRGSHMEVMNSLTSLLIRELPTLNLTIGYAGEAPHSCSVREYIELERVCQRIAGEGVRWRLYQGRIRIKSIRDIDIGRGSHLTLVNDD